MIDVTQKKAGWIATLGAALVIAGGVAVREAGYFVDDAVRVGGKGAADVLLDPGTPTAVKQGVTTFRAMRKGTDAEQIVVQVACSYMNTYLAASSSADQFASDIRSGLPPELLDGIQGHLTDRYVTRAANAMYWAEISGGIGRWYVQYCALTK